jgi:RNA polymerase sigma-70 factor (ECF subfamily)
VTGYRQKVTPLLSLCYDLLSFGCPLRTPQTPYPMDNVIIPRTKAPTVTDEELIALFQQGDEQAFVTLVGRFKNPLTNFVYRLLGELDEADDIVQETFLRVYSHRHSYNPVAKFSTWLYRIALNLATSALRRETRRRRYLKDGMLAGFALTRADREAHDPDMSIDSQVDTTITLQLVQKALMQISPVFREVVVLRDIQGLTYEEIAGITGLELGTIKSRISRGRSHLQKLLKDIYRNEEGDVR